MFNVQMKVKGEWTTFYTFKSYFEACDKVYSDQKHCKTLQARIVSDKPLTIPMSGSLGTTWEALDSLKD